VHQPEVARLARLLLAFVLVLPVLDAGRCLLVAGAFVTEFLGSPGSRPLTRLTGTPERVPFAVAGASVDRYRRRADRDATPLVLVHGLSPDGKDDPRLVDAAALLARAGFDVAVPTVPGLTRMRLRPDDREPVIATVAARPPPVVMVGVSVGAGVALLAAADERIRERVDLVLSLGGYASARELVRYYLTGDYGDDEARGHRDHDPALVRMFVDANADLLDASTQALLAADRREVSRALDALSPDVARLLDALSPAQVLPRVRADLVLVHGRDDIAVPFTESVVLWRARPHRSRLVLVGVVAHVEAAPGVALAAGLRDLAALWSVVYALVVRA
jgi:pimeloyl-ACP methyl ester carboxylesterase